MGPLRDRRPFPFIRYEMMRVRGMDLETLRSIVENEVENYCCPFLTGTVGTPWTEERVGAELAAMKSALVSPYWSDVEIARHPPGDCRLAYSVAELWGRSG